MLAPLFLTIASVSALWRGEAAGRPASGPTAVAAPKPPRPAVTPPATDLVPAAGAPTGTRPLVALVASLLLIALTAFHLLPRPEGRSRAR